MIAPMNATPSSQVMPSSPKRPRGLSKAKALILSANPTRAQWIERQIEASSFAHLGVDKRSLKDGLESLPRIPADLVILDVEDLSVDPLQCLKHIRLLMPQTAVMVISRMIDVALASRSLRLGATAYLTADEADQLLTRALNQVASGERFVSEEVMQGILHGMVESGLGENSLPVEALSDREMVVFQLVGQGNTFREIADELKVNIKTVATHCNNIRRKLHSRDNRHLTRISRNWVADNNPAPDPGRESISPSR